MESERRFAFRDEAVSALAAAGKTVADLAAACGEPEIKTKERLRIDAGGAAARPSETTVAKLAELTGTEPSRWEELLFDITGMAPSKTRKAPKKKKAEAPAPKQDAVRYAWADGRPEPAYRMATPRGELWMVGDGNGGWRAVGKESTRGTMAAAASELGGGSSIEASLRVVGQEGGSLLIDASGPKPIRVPMGAALGLTAVGPNGERRSLSAGEAE